jgi:photosystem II stability/assembly factor-like uncharacterized protein
VVGLAVNPRDHAEYYVAAGHGSLFKTTTGGVTFEPVFDGESSFSIGAVTLDPSDPHVVWVGTGENNAQSYVVPGDGVYKSEDGGKSWTNKGLKESQQIGAIVVHPKQPNTVWVAAYGPHRALGERTAPERPHRLLGTAHGPSQPRRVVRRRAPAPALPEHGRHGRR